jgi:hypothetical protein
MPLESGLSMMNLDITAFSKYFEEQAESGRAVWPHVVWVESLCCGC